MASRKDRQRKLERARIERRIARQAASQRRRRQIQAGVGASLALVLIILGTVWALGGFKSTPKTKETVAAGTCTWYLRDADESQNIYDTGHPPTTGELRSGTVNATITTNLGDIKLQLDREKAPCTVASFVYLAEKKFMEQSDCHRLTTSGIYVLQCGDPSGTGSGGPSYLFANEYVPPTPTPSATASASPEATADASTPATVTYEKGVLAMAHSSAANSNGSQFFIVYKDSPLAADYTIFGKVTQGLDIVEKVAKAGVTAASDGTASADGKPAETISIQSITIGDTASASASPDATATASASASVAAN